MDWKCGPKTATYDSSVHTKVTILVSILKQSHTNIWVLEFYLQRGKCNEIKYEKALQRNVQMAKGIWKQQSLIEPLTFKPLNRFLECLVA